MRLGRLILLWKASYFSLFTIAISGFDGLFNMLWFVLDAIVLMALIKLSGGEDIDSVWHSAWEP